MNINDFNLIQTLYEYKNISRTAEALFLAQPTVSKRLQLIEEEFGIKLVHRSRQGVEFTPEGEYLAVKAAQINGTMAEIRRHLEEMSREQVHKLTIGASNSSIHSSFMDALEEFHTRFPKIQIELINEKSSHLAKQVELGKLDFAFVMGDVVFSGEKFQLTQERAFIGSSVPVEPDALPGLPYLEYAFDPATQRILHKWWEEHYTSPFPSGLRVSGAEVARDLVLRGLGYSFFFREDYIEELKDHAYFLTDWNGEALVRINWGLYHKDRLSERPEAQRFLTFLREKFGRAEGHTTEKTIEEKQD